MFRVRSLVEVKGLGNSYAKISTFKFNICDSKKEAKSNSLFKGVLMGLKASSNFLLECPFEKVGVSNTKHAALMNYCYFKLQGYYQILNFSLDDKMIPRGISKLDFRFSSQLLNNDNHQVISFVLYGLRNSH